MPSPEATTTEPFYRNDDKLFDARPLDNASMEIWAESAAAAIQHMRPGGVNWPMMIRSLSAEVYRLRAILEQGLACIMGDTPEDMTREEAQADTLQRIKDALNGR